MCVCVRVIASLVCVHQPGPPLSVLSRCVCHQKDFLPLLYISSRLSPSVALFVAVTATSKSSSQAKHTPNIRKTYAKHTLRIRKTPAAMGAVQLPSSVYDAERRPSRCKIIEPHDVRVFRETLSKKVECRVSCLSVSRLLLFQDR